MLQPVSVPLIVLALLSAGCLYGLLVRPLWQRRRERRNTHAFHDAQGRLAIQPSAFQLLKPTSTADLLMVDPLVQEAILQETERSGTDQCDALVEAREYAREIVPSLSGGFYFRLIHGPLKRWMLRLFRVRVRYLDEDAIVRAARTSTPVFVLNHRSNLDYVIAATSLADRAILSFAVGEWARYWPLEGLLRALGGFFVRRGSGNPLYRAVLAAHVKAATRAGVPQAFFIEGRFSDDGKLGSPRLGLLDYAVRAFDPESRRDVAFVPVAVNYDRVIEDKNLQIMKAQGKTCDPHRIVASHRRFSRPPALAAPQPPLAALRLRHPQRGRTGIAQGLACEPGLRPPGSRPRGTLPGGRTSRRAPHGAHRRNHAGAARPADGDGDPERGRGGNHAGRGARRRLRNPRDARGPSRRARHPSRGLGAGGRTWAPAPDCSDRW